MRKNIIYSVTALLFLIACNKDELIEKTELSQVSAARINCFDGIQRDCNGEILMFNDEAHFVEVYECLQQQYEAWNDAFELQYSSLNDNDFNTLADSIGFNEDSTLVAFEQNYPGYVSQRSKLRSLEALWLDNTNLDPATNPYNNDYLDDLILQTMFNQYQEVRIGNRILHISEIDGTVYTLQAGFCDLLSTLRSDPTSLIGNPAVTSHQDSTGTSECKVNKFKQGEKNLPNQEYYFWKLSFNNYFLIGTSAKGCMKYYKQKNNGKWKKHKRKISVDVYGTAWNWDCDTSDTYSKQQLTLKRRSQRDVNNFFDGKRLKIKNNFAKGSFYLDNRSTYDDYTIDW
jgi:hypothetical protein